MRQVTQQVSVRPPASPPVLCRDAAAATTTATASSGVVRTTATTTTQIHRPSTLAVQHQQREMQYLQNLRHAHGPAAAGAAATCAAATNTSAHGAGAGLMVRSPSPGAARALRNPPTGGARDGQPSEPTKAASGYSSPMVSHMVAPGASLAPGSRTPLPSGATTPIVYPAHGSCRTESPLVYPARTISPMAKQVAAPVRYGAYAMKAGVPMSPAAGPVPGHVTFGAVVMNGREVARPQVPVAFKAAPPNFARVIPPQASTGAAVTPRQVAATEKPGATTPVPAGTMERVRARQESKQ